MLYMKYQFDDSVDRIYVDGANPSFIRSLKLAIGKREDYDKVLDKHRTGPWKDPASHMTVIHVNFACCNTESGLISNIKENL
jgi:hypothetical protein